MTEVPAPVRMYELLYSSLVSQLLVAVAEIGVADAIGETEVCHVDELAARTGADPGSLYRALRALASVGVFAEVDRHHFRLTPLAATLRSDDNGSMRDLARYVGLPERQRSFGALAHSVRTGRPAFDHVHGTDWWSYFGQRPELTSLFNNAMGTMARMVNSATLQAHDLSGVRRLVDVGAGKGLLVASLLRRYPQLRAVVFDLPQVVDEAQRLLGEAGLADRVDCVAGDFLTSVPAGGDAYVLSWTIHDWDDKDAVTILSNIRSVMDSDGQVIIIDEVLADGNEPHFGKFEDIVMMALLRGRVRTESEFIELFEAAGLRHRRTLQTSAPTSVVIAEPA